MIEAGSFSTTVLSSSTACSTLKSLYKRAHNYGSTLAGVSQLPARIWSSLMNVINVQRSLMQHIQVASSNCVVRSYPVRHPNPYFPWTDVHAIRKLHCRFRYHSLLYKEPWDDEIGVWLRETKCIKTRDCVGHSILRSFSILVDEVEFK